MSWVRQQLGAQHKAPHSTAPTCSLSRKSCCSSSSQKDTGLSSRRRHTASQLWLLDSLDSSSHTASRIPASPFMLFTYTSRALTPVLMSSLHLEAKFHLCEGGEALARGAWLLHVLCCLWLLN